MNSGTGVSLASQDSGQCPFDSSVPLPAQVARGRRNRTRERSVSGAPRHVCVNNQATSPSVAPAARPSRTAPFVPQSSAFVALEVARREGEAVALLSSGLFAATALPAALLLGLTGGAPPVAQCGVTRPCELSACSASTTSS